MWSNGILSIEHLRILDLDWALAMSISIFLYSLDSVHIV